MNAFVNTSISTIAFAVILATGALSGCGGGGGGGSTPATQGGSGTTSAGSDGTSTVSTTPANQAPTVTCTTPAATSVGVEVAVTCVVSDDTKAARDLNYAWELTPPPSVSASLTPVVTAGANTGARVTPPAPGTYTVKLTVSDGQASTVSTVTFKTRWRILPLGDSITQGSSSGQSYRYPLWKKLIDQGAAFEFVGSMTKNYGATDPSFPDYKGQKFENRHEGHWGARTDEILNTRINQNGDNEGRLVDWLQSYTPDIALVHLGTNDLLNEFQPVSGIVDELGSVVSTLKADNPNMRIFVAKIIPTTNGASVEVAVTPLNDAIAAASWASSVTIVDQFTGFDRVADTIADNIHPNASGDEKIAQRWFDAIKGIVQ